MLTQHKQWIIDNLMPLGEVRLYQGSGKFIPDSVYQNSRFIKERTSSIVRRPISNRSLEAYPSQMISYSYHHAITAALHQNPEVFFYLEDLGNRVEDALSNYITSCDHAVVLFVHRAVVDQMIMHTHRLPDTPMFSVTAAIRITDDDSTPVVVQFHHPINDTDPNLTQYFINHNSVLEYTKDKTPAGVPLATDRTLLMFNAAFTPHQCELY